VFTATLRLGAAIALAVTTVASAALADASSEQYRGCDGYGAASSGGDGMTEYATVLLIFNPPGYGNTMVGKTSPGQVGVADCDAALADLPEKHWMRRVSLLRARAIHHLDTGDKNAALADLDAADAAVKDAGDPFYARSLGIGLTLARAFALHVSGQQAKAEALAESAVAARPYDRHVLVSALMAMGPPPNAEASQRIERSIAKLVPTLIDRLFFVALTRGRYQEAVELYPQLTPYRYMGTIYDTARSLYQRGVLDTRMAAAFHASRGGAYAYGLAALGKPAEARAALDEVRAGIKTQYDEPPPLDPSLTPAERVRAIALRDDKLAQLKRLGDDGQKALGDWPEFVEYRAEIDEGKARDVLKAVQAKPLKTGWARDELLNALIAALPKTDKSDIAAANALLGTATITAMADTRADEFFKTLPETETPSRVPPYVEAAKPFLAMTGSRADLDEEGYRANGADASGVVKVRMRGDSTTAPIVEEMALLHAADLARQAGKGGFIVVAREDIAYSVNTMYYGTVMRTDPDGFETTLSVVFVDPANLPAPYAHTAWRMFDANEVYGALAPIYIRPKKT